MTPPVTVYLSASMARAGDMSAVADVLRRYDVEVVSTWHDHVVPNPDAERAAQVAKTDLEELSSAGVLIALAETSAAGYQTGGRHVEFGVALALGLRIILVGTPEHVFGHLANVVQVVPDMLEAVAALWRPPLVFDVAPGRRQYLVGLPITREAAP